ncbi:TIGR00341 family protein [Halobacillus sp. A1]|uniref:TIGR00341 family protein n=1 Tax=Halobacillus sp. A1 TaxID=2880262 RepID=UPI0020A6CA2C|nr:TIGR00341 family protein [Halobacillus sp. A1]MCP3032419.1 TIGR00341 family protein [Halobacillus sp. A1]
MSLQLVEVHVPPTHLEFFRDQLNSYTYESCWVEIQTDGRSLFRILSKKGNVEDILNDLEGISHSVKGFETVLFPVRAYFSNETIKAEKKEEQNVKLQRLSRHELLASIKKNSKTTWNYLLLIILSAIVATVGFLKDSEAVVIGAMVIAPMIGPVIAVAFSSVLGDYKVLSKSLITSLLGVVIVVAISILFVLFSSLELTTNQYLSRTVVTPIDIILGVASGAAGALAFINRLSGNLVGVMVAVALLPPSVALGISIGSMEWDLAYGAFLLVTVNIMSILLAAVIIFSISGIRPVQWREVQRANVSRPLSILFVSVIVVVLALLIFVSEGTFNL